MKKLHLDSLRVESFATTARTPQERGTVLGRQLAGTQARGPLSYNGTCWITCWDSCFCETVYEC
jgi:hypothetical protein